MRMTRPVCPLQSLRHCSCVHLQETLYVVGKKGRGYEWNYDRARSDPSWLLMEMPINVGCAILFWSWRRTCSWGRRQNKTIATQSSPDSHRMCCCDQLGIPSYHPCSASSIQIATAIVFLAKSCTVRLVYRGWLQRPIFMDRQTCSGVPPNTARSFTCCGGVPPYFFQ